MSSDLRINEELKLVAVRLPVSLIKEIKMLALIKRQTIQEWITKSLDSSVEEATSGKSRG